MKSNFPKWALLTLILSAIISFSAYSFSEEENPAKDQVVMKAIFSTLKSGHYSEISLDDEFSKEAFKIYLSRLDYYKRFLLKNEIKELKAYETLLDDHVKTSNLEFFEKSYTLISKALKRSNKYFKDALKKEMDFTENDKLNTEPEDYDFLKSEKDLQERWRLLLKREVIQKIYTAKTQAEDDEEKEFVFEEAEKEAREKVLESYEDWYERMMKINRNDRYSIYVNSLTAALDPHTNFYPPQDKENFDIAMSGRLEGIGASLSEKDGYIKVMRIVPGSASWKQGDLKAEDIIIKVAQKDEDPVDVVDMRLDEVVKMIRGPKGTLVNLTVKKPNGSIVEIPIVRDEVILKETYAKSAVIEDKKNGVKTGIINLPKFYADFNNKNGRNCSDDVRKELEKLKAENVEGIILDLRNNSGGSLRDVVEMTGFFIDEGPIVQIKSRTGKPYILEDKDEGIVWDGPLVVMVNEFSASASEILAAAIQDYGRGVVIGSAHTYGKGTVQRIYNLDPLVRGDFDEFKPLGSVKITTQKFYRVNGGTTQHKGVISDIIIPDKYSYLEIGEKEQENSLPWDEIEPQNYNEWQSKWFDLAEIQKKSKSRVLKNETFTLIDENAKRLKAQRENDILPLKFNDYLAFQKQRKEEAKKYEDLAEPVEYIDVYATAEDMEEIKSDTVQKETMERWFKGVKKDLYMIESTAVIADMANQLMLAGKIEDE